MWFIKVLLHHGIGFHILNLISQCFNKQCIILYYYLSLLYPSSGHFSLHNLQPGGSFLTVLSLQSFPLSQASHLTTTLHLFFHLSCSSFIITFNLRHSSVSAKSRLHLNESIRISLPPNVSGTQIDIIEEIRNWICIIQRRSSRAHCKAPEGLKKLLHRKCG
jgi:hypothetical protein